MKTIKLAVLMLALCLISSNYASGNGDKEEVTFNVGCFDVGASALQSRPGVISVQKRWLASGEVNHVVFDPQKVNVTSMEAWLKSAGTYIGTEKELGQKHE